MYTQFLAITVGGLIHWAGMIPCDSWYVVCTGEAITAADVAIAPALPLCSVCLMSSSTLEPV